MPSPFRSFATPHVQARLHLVLTTVWLVLILPTLLFWSSSILWVALMSIWANVAGHYSSFLAARAERRLDPDDPL